MHDRYFCIVFNRCLPTQKVQKLLFFLILDKLTQKWSFFVTMSQVIVSPTVWVVVWDVFV